MSFIVTIKTGVDAGKRFRLDGHDRLVGRSPTAIIGLSDDSVAWEHATLSVEGDKVVLRNLAASGTVVRNRTIRDEATLRSGEEVQLSESCILRVKRRGGSESNPPSLMLIAVAVVVLAIGAALLPGLLKTGDQAIRQRVTAGHWSLCFSEIYQRLKAWEEERIIPVETAPLFFDGWRLRTSGDYEAAFLVYQRLHTLLFMTDLPTRFMEEGEPNMTYSHAAKDRRSNLRHVMGLDNPPTDARSDRNIAHALVWFVQAWRDQLERSVSKE